jgi:transcriptional regulator with XRE-family HTH domain
MTISERLASIVDIEKNQAEFCRKTGIGRATLNQIIRGNRNMSSSTIEMVLKAFPKLNARWLITGEGEIWKSDYEEKYKNLSQEVEDLLKELEEKTNVIKNLNKFSEYLQRENERLIKDLDLEN